MVKSSTAGSSSARAEVTTVGAPVAASVPAQGNGPGGEARIGRRRARRLFGAGGHAAGLGVAVARQVDQTAEVVQVEQAAAEPRHIRAGHLGDPVGEGVGPAQIAHGLVVAQGRGASLDGLLAEQEGPHHAHPRPFELLLGAGGFLQILQDDRHGPRSPTSVVRDRSPDPPSTTPSRGPVSVIRANSSTSCARSWTSRYRRQLRPSDRMRPGHAQHRPVRVLFARSGEDELGVGLLDVALLDAQADAVVPSFGRRVRHQDDVFGGVRRGGLGRLRRRPGISRRPVAGPFRPPRRQRSPPSCWTERRRSDRRPGCRRGRASTGSRRGRRWGVVIGAVVEGSAPCPQRQVTPKPNGMSSYMWFSWTRTWRSASREAGVEARIEEGIAQDVHGHGQILCRDGDVVIGGLVTGTGVGSCRRRRPLPGRSRFPVGGLCP